MGEDDRTTGRRQIRGVVVVFDNHGNALQRPHCCRVAAVLTVLVPSDFYGMRMHGQQRIEARALLIIALDALQQALREFRTGEKPLSEAGMDISDAQFHDEGLWV